jgi:hypothetical protein
LFTCSKRYFSLLGTRALRVPQYKPQQYCMDLLLTVHITYRSDLSMLLLYWEYGLHFPLATINQLLGKVTPVQPPGQSCKEEEGPPLSNEIYRPSPTRYFTIHTFTNYTVVIYIYMRPSLLIRGKNNFINGKNNFSSKLDSANTFFFF